MIKFITADEVLAIRNQVLREGRLPLNECRFATDTLPGSFHLGYFNQEALVCIVSFHLQNYSNIAGTGYQLRGMASLPEYQGKGIGTQLVDYAINYLKQQQADHVWCNARKKAMLFYERLGFSVMSDEFEVPGIGPHFAMCLQLKQTTPGTVI